MNKLIKRILAVMIIFIVIAPQCFLTRVNAASNASISVGSKSVGVGDDFSISVTINKDANAVITAAQIWITYDPDILQLTTANAGGSGKAYVLSNGESSMTLSFKAKQAGSTSLVVSESVVGIDSDIINSPKATSGYVTVSAPVNYSTDNTLSSLEISPGVLSPAFSPNVTEYTTSVGADCSQLVVNAIANDSAASVSVSGRKLDPGRNTTTITVTAENSSVRKYVIYTTKEDSSDSSTENIDKPGDTPDQPSDGTTEDEVTQSIPTAKVDGKDFTVANDFAAHPLPSGYEVSDFDYDGRTIQVGKGINTKLILMYLESPDGGSGFYVYDSVSKAFTPYNEVSQPEITYVILPITDTMERPEGYKLTTYKINEKEVQVLMDDTKNFALFYGVSSTGVTGWFRYDCKDGTIQSFTDMGNPIQITENQVSSAAVSIWKKVAIGLGILAGVLLAAVIVLAVKAAENKKRLLAAIKDGSGGARMALHADEDELFTDDYEEDEEDDDLLEEDSLADGDDNNDNVNDDTDAHDAADARAAKEKYQREVAATVEPGDKNVDAITDQEDDMFDKVSKALEKNLAESAMSPEEEDDLDFLDIEELDDK